MSSKPKTKKKQPPKFKKQDLEFQTTWSLWYDKKVRNQEKPNRGGMKAESWKNHLQKVGTFHSVLGFWRYYAWTKKPSELEPGTNVYVFREDLHPMWETFPQGGCWIIRFHKDNAANGIIDRVWEELLLAVLGEQFRTPELVGVSLSARQSSNKVSHIISLWNRDSEKKPRAKFSIGERLKVLLHLAAESQIEYKLFSKALQDGSTFRGAQPYIYVPV